MKNRVKKLFFVPSKYNCIKLWLSLGIFETTGNKPLFFKLDQVEGHDINTKYEFEFAKFENKLMNNMENIITFIYFIEILYII